MLNIILIAFISQMNLKYRRQVYPGGDIDQAR